MPSISDRTILTCPKCNQYFYFYFRHPNEPNFIGQFYSDGLSTHCESSDDNTIIKCQKCRSISFTRRCKELSTQEQKDAQNLERDHKLGRVFSRGGRLRGNLIEHRSSAGVGDLARFLNTPHEFENTKDELELRLIFWRAVNDRQRNPLFAHEDAFWDYDEEEVHEIWLENISSLIDLFSEHHSLEFLSVKNGEDQWLYVVDKVVKVRGRPLPLPIPKKLEFEAIEDDPFRIIMLAELHRNIGEFKEAMDIMSSMKSEIYIDLIKPFNKWCDEKSPSLKTYSHRTVIPATIY